jgi:P4 family phage/plasmid primase-like protien
MPEFPKGQKADCFKYAKDHKLSVFQRDLNETFSKVLLVDSYENIFNKIKSGDNSYYEYWSADTPLKLYIDYDRKNKDKDENSNGDTNSDPGNITKEPHKSEILNIINVMIELIPQISDVNILKSIPNIDKKSYHIIFDGIYLPGRAVMKRFMEEQFKPRFKTLFEEKIIDIKVYGDLCFRTLLSTKFKQNRLLYLLNTEDFINELKETPYTKDETTLEQFLQSSITYIPETSILFTYKSEKKKNNSKKIHLMNEEDIYSEKDIIKKYLDILDPDRYTDYNKWINIGFILYSLSNEYIDLWKYFSSKWELYDEANSISKWNSFANSEYIYTINNLKYLAEIDNPNEAAELSREIPAHDVKFLRPFDNVLSKLIYRLYGDRFICSNPEKNEWYYFNGIRWIKENKNHNLRKRIIDEVFNKIEIYRRQLIKEGASEDIIKNYHNILLKLGSGIKLNCLELEFYNSNFYKIIDQNKDLLGFDNGIYDLKTFEFRPGVSSDYVSLSTGYEYINYSQNDSVYIELVELLKKILPEEETHNFTLKALASCLDGHNRDENFYIFTGARGANGKSTILDLLLKSLGEYAIISPVSLITGSREQANSANSALAAIRNKRAVVMQEPASNVMIQSDTLKGLTGGDTISTRELNASQIEFKPNAKLFMATNLCPILSSLDGGVIRRLKITDFVSHFVDNPDPNRPFEFKIDRELKNKLEKYKSAFMCILLNYYKIYREEGLVPPPAVIKVTKKYEENNNIIKTFVQETLTISNVKTDFITKTEMKEFYRTDYNLKSYFPKFNNFVTELETFLCLEFKYDPKKNVSKLLGVHKKEPQLDDEEDEL